MKRIGIIAIIVISCFFSMSAQSLMGNKWITGLNGQLISFENNAINIKYSTSYNHYFIDGNSNICDSNGNLVLTSDGYNIYDKIGSFLEEGDTLLLNDFYIQYNGSSGISQTSIFLPLDSNKYYFINAGYSQNRYNECINNIACNSDILHYNLIDMNVNNGAGKVVKRMQTLIENVELSRTQMMACRHGNGKDWWLLKQAKDSNIMYKFLFTQDSIYNFGRQAFQEPNWGKYDLLGQSSFNQDGTMYASVAQGGDTKRTVFLADFDRCYGILSNPLTIQAPLLSCHDPNFPNDQDFNATGVAFSPNGRFVYLSTYFNIFQYDLQDETWYHVVGLDTTWQKFARYSNMYLGPDSKLYVGNWYGGSTQMSRIDNPDVKGVGCNFCPRCLRLDSLGANAYVGTPPCMPNYGLGAKPCWPLDTPNISLDNGMVVYPNPAYSTITIKNRKGKKKEMYDCIGQMIYETLQAEINVSSFAKGVYFIKCEGETKKVIIE